jgi:LPXTG-motif cell wall-anchored protein
MRNALIYTIVLITVALFLTRSAVAQEKTVVKATVNRTQILIGEPITLTLEADVPEHEPIRFFQLDSIPHFEFLDRQKIDTVNTGSGTVLTQVLQITSFDSGHWVIPSMSLGENLATDSIPIDVGFSPFNPDQPYHDIKEIIEVTPEEKKEQIKWWYIVAGAAALLLILILIFRKKKKPAVEIVQPPPDPYKKAMEQLKKLQSEKVDAKQYYSRLTDIFRVYVFEKKGIHSLQNTTHDLVAQMRSLDMPKDLFDRLEQGLMLSDFVKFAKYVPSQDNDKNVFDIIVRTIQQIEHH